MAWIYLIIFQESLPSVCMSQLVFLLIYVYVQWNWKFRLYYLLESACKYFAYWIFFFTYTIHITRILFLYAWFFHDWYIFFKYACIFSNAFSCVLMCYICFLHTPFILHIYFFLHAWNFHDWYIFLKYACIFSNGWSCVLVCCMYFIHHSQIICEHACIIDIFNNLEAYLHSMFAWHEYIWFA